MKYYYAIDEIKEENNFNKFPTETINSFKIPSCPNYKLGLKIGAPIIILKNVNPPKITNGTRAIIREMHKHIIICSISSGPFKDVEISLPRIIHDVDDHCIPVPFRRR